MKLPRQMDVVEETLRAVYVPLSTDDEIAHRLSQSTDFLKARDLTVE